MNCVFNRVILHIFPMVVKPLVDGCSLIHCSSDDWVFICRCKCGPRDLCEVPDCEDGMRLQVVSPATGVPGHCCDSVKCVNGKFLGVLCLPWPVTGNFMSSFIRLTHLLRLTAASLSLPFYVHLFHIFFILLWCSKVFCCLWENKIALWLLVIEFVEVKRQGSLWGFAPKQLCMNCTWPAGSLYIRELLC